MRTSPQTSATSVWLAATTAVLVLLQTLFPYLCGRFVHGWGYQMVIFTSGLVSIAPAFVCVVLAGRAIIRQGQLKLPLLSLIIVTLFGVSCFTHNMPGSRCFLIGLRQRIYAAMPLNQWHELAKTVEAAAARTKSGRVFFLGTGAVRADTPEDEPVIAELNTALRKFGFPPNFGAVFYGQPRTVNINWREYGFHLNFAPPENFTPDHYLDWWASDPDVIFYME